MNKARVEAFTDAIIAIIMTIMILEFKTPESPHLSALIPQIPYAVSYAISYFFIGVAWYNHHYMFARVHVVTRQIFWSNMFWLFSTSFIPVAISWTSRDLSARGPEIFYFIVYIFWGAAYTSLTYFIVKSDEKRGYMKSANSIRNMRAYETLTNWKLLTIITIVWILILIFFPAGQMFMVLYIVLMGTRTNSDSDKLFLGEDKHE